MAGLSVDTYRMSRAWAVKDARIYEPDDYKARVKQMFSKRAPQYDFKNDFHPPLCEQLVFLADLKGRSLRVLDVATGTGTVAMSAACALGPSGTVTAVDVSEEMLTQAGPPYRFARGTVLLCSTQMPTEAADGTCTHARTCWQMPEDLTVVAAVDCIPVSVKQLFKHSRSLKAFSFDETIVLLHGVHAEARACQMGLSMASCYMPFACPEYALGRHVFTE